MEDDKKKILEALTDPSVYGAAAIQTGIPYLHARAIMDEIVSDVNHLEQLKTPPPLGTPDPLPPGADY